MKKKKKDERKKNAELTSGRLLVLPYVKGLSETTARIMMKYGINCAFKPENTLGQQLFRLKDKNEDGRCYLQGSVQKLPQFVYQKNYLTIGGQVKGALC